ncbi:MAG TPA: hypothetical protein VMH86_01590 [Rhizomicrobium sp.]|nr:hypothetical protein [Rhizomicrobium sp.]
MFNLLVTRHTSGWKGNEFKYSSNRVLKSYTKKHLSDRYASLDDNVLKELSSYPVLFTSAHGAHSSAHIGWIKRVRTKNAEVRVEYFFDQAFSPIPFSSVSKLDWDLDIDKREMTLAHWALKEADLFTILLEANLISSAQFNLSRAGKIAEAATSTADAAGSRIRPVVFRMEQLEVEHDLVAVMMPFTTDLEATFLAIRQACDTNNMRCKRVDHIWNASEIVQDIFSLIRRASIVVCDLTGHNPNVFYEAGIAHTLGKDVILITQEVAKLSFDIRHHRVIDYTANPGGLGSLTHRLGQRLRALAVQTRAEAGRHPGH